MKTVQKSKKDLQKKIKKFYYQTIKDIKWFFFKKEIQLTDSVKKQLFQFLQNRNLVDIVQVHDVKAKKKKDHIRVYITCVKPGVMIGKKGSTVDELEDFLSDVQFQKIIISVNDFNIWKPFKN